MAPPVDVLGLARRYADVSFESLPVDADGICFDLKKGGVRPKIVLNRNRPRTRTRFTVAHELGHVLLPWHVGFIVDEAGTDDIESFGLIAMEAEANRFAAELLMPNEWLLGAVMDASDPVSTVTRVAVEAAVSSAAAVIRIMPLLPPGYIYARVDGDGLVTAAGRSPGTTAERPLSGTCLDSAHEIYQECEQHWFGTISGAKHYWWKMPARIKPQQWVEVPVPTDVREWRIILNEILDDHPRSHELRQHLTQSINGVIGSANARGHGQSPEELYALLLNRLEERKAENPDYAALVDHPQFEDWLALRVRILRGLPQAVVTTKPERPARASEP